MKRQQITLTNEKYIELMNILVNARKISKLTQKQMAQRLGGSNKWLSDIENLMPYERDIYYNMIINYIAEQEQNRG